MPDSKDEKVEKIIAVTTKELCDYYRAKTGIGISTDNLKKQYLNELLSNDIIGELLSEIDKRQHIYYPLVENGNPEAPNEVKMSKLSNSHQFDNFLQQPYIQLPKNCKDIPENWLIFEILGIANCRIGLAGVGGCLADFLNQTGDLKFYDMNDINNNKSNRNDVNDNRSKRLTVKEFISRYESNLSIRHILKGDLYNFHSKIFGNMIGFCILSYNKPKILSNESKFDNFDISSGGNHPKEATSTPDYNNMQQSNVVLQQKADSGLEHGLTIRKELVEHLDAKVKCVEEFFLDNPDLEYQPADSHSLEQSPCVPIIDSKVEASIVWFNCKLHPGIVNINLSSIEHHCKYFEPDLHKSRDLEYVESANKGAARTDKDR